MKIRPSILSTIAVAFPCAAALAQGSQEARIIRAAADFVRGDMPVGAIMVDADMYLADTAVADEVSRQLGASRGRYQEAMHCEAHGIWRVSQVLSLSMS